MLGLFKLYFKLQPKLWKGGVMVYSDIVCPECKKGNLVTYNGLTEDKKGLSFFCHFCKIFFKIDDEGGYLPSKTRILGEKYPPLKGLSFS